MNKKFAWILIFLFAFFSLIHTFIIAQTESGGKLIGFIYKSNKKTPMKDAKVILINILDGKQYESNVTDDKGDYTIDQLPPGSYNVYLEINDKEFKVKKIDFVVKIEKDKISFMSFSINKRFPFIIIIPIGSLSFLPPAFSPTTR